MLFAKFFSQKNFAVIDQNLAQERSLRMRNFKKLMLRRKIMALGSLPTLPDNVMELMQKLRDPQVSVRDIIDRISRDQVLTAQILKLVNSGYYSVRNQIHTIDQAVALVGFVKVWELLVSSSVMQILAGNENELWEHSYTTSLLVRELIFEERIRCSSRLQLTTLMHDIGKVVLLKYNAKAYRNVREQCQNEGRASWIEEEAVFGVNHAEVGGWLLEGWELSEEQVVPIQEHHQEEINPTYAVDTLLIRFADCCDNMVRGIPTNSLRQDDYDKAGLGHLDVLKWAKRQEEIIAENQAPSKDPTEMSKTSMGISPAKK